MATTAWSRLAAATSAAGRRRCPGRVRRALGTVRRVASRGMAADGRWLGRHGLAVAPAPAVPAVPEPLHARLGRHPHPLAVGPEAEQRADSDAEIDRENVLELGGHAERVVAEPEDRVLDQQAHAVQHEEGHALPGGTPALAMPEAPVPVAEERDDRRDDGRDRDRRQRAEPERAVQRDEDQVGDADPDGADDQELGTLVDDVAETPVEFSDALDGHWGGAGTAQCGYPASSPVVGVRLARSA